MTEKIPEEVLQLIGQFSSMQFTTKKYKKRKNAHKCKVEKVKYVCCVCNGLKNHNQYNHDMLQCKPICLDFSLQARKRHLELDASMTYTGRYCFFPYGQHWRTCQKYDSVIEQLEEKLGINR